MNIFITILMVILGICIFAEFFFKKKSFIILCLNVIELMIGMFLSGYFFHENSFFETFCFIGVGLMAFCNTKSFCTIRINEDK